MTIADEEQWMGEEMHLVPALDPDDDCNGKTPKRDDEGQKIRNDDDHVLFGGYCSNSAGKGTDHFGEGRCKYHAGQAGAPAHNQNAQTHSLTADPHHYHESLDPDRQEWIQQMSNTILDRVAKFHGRDPDFLDEALARRVAIKFDMVAKASDYSKDDLVQVIVHDGSSHEEKGALVEEIRRFDNAIIQNLNKLGVLESPEQQKADSLGDWREFVESGSQKQNNTRVIDVENKNEQE